jgi:hypothetical protein
MSGGGVLLVGVANKVLDSTKKIPHAVSIK